MTDGVRIDFLGSGSGGNATLIRCDGRALLIDAGFSPAELTRRLAAIAVEPGAVDALVLTHAHDDHMRGAAALAGRDDLTVIGSSAAIKAVRDCNDRWSRVHLKAARPLELGRLSLMPFSVPHDARGGTFGFVVTFPDGQRLGYATDVGSLTGAITDALRGCHVLALEANHDVERLYSGPYPQFLKHRIASPFGHLSNVDAGRLLSRVAGPQLRQVFAMHLSETNNEPAAALEALRRGLPAGANVSVQVIGQHQGASVPGPGQQLRLL